MKRSPAAAAWLSLLPGLGHLYVGYTTKGLVFALLAVSVIQIASESDGPLGLFIPFVWLYAMIDAHRSAVEVNRLAASGAKLPRSNFDLSKWWGYILIGLGGLLVLENFDIIDFDWLWRLWPLGLIAMGVYILKRKPLPPLEPSESAAGASDEPSGSVAPVPPVPPAEESTSSPSSEPESPERENA
jgi:hypothetical protein